MPVLRCPQTGRRYEMNDNEVGRIRTALKLGWEDVTPPAVEKPVAQEETQELPVVEVKPGRKRGK